MKKTREPEMSPERYRTGNDCVALPGSAGYGDESTGRMMLLTGYSGGE